MIARAGARTRLQREGAVGDGPTIKIYGTHLLMYGDAAVFIAYDSQDGYTEAESFALFPDCSISSWTGKLDDASMERLEEKVADFEWDVEEYLVDQATRDIEAAYSEYLRQEDVPNAEAWARSGVELKSGSVPGMSRIRENDDCLEALEEIKDTTEFPLLREVIDVVSSTTVERRGGWE